MEDDAIITALQRGIPLASRPFAALGRTLDMTEDAIIEVLRRMLADGSARRFGAVFDARRLGYRSELCAMVVPEADLYRIGAVVAAHPGVTHGYHRGHPPGQPACPPLPGVVTVPNLWFTLAVLRDRFDADMAVLETSVAPYGIWRLPAMRRFKIDLLFDPAHLETGERVPGTSTGEETAATATARNGPAASTTGRHPDFEMLSDDDCRIVQALEGDVPVCTDLFAAIAASLGMQEHALLETLRGWERSGTLRRIAMVVRHRQIGFTSNAMCIWPVDAGRLVDAGRRLASWPAVTHCYARAVRSGWPYNLYAMIHTADWDSTQRLFERIRADAGLANGRILGSLHEFKKTSMPYFATP